MSVLDETSNISKDIRYALIGVTFFAPFSAAIFSKTINTEGKWISILNCFAAGVFVGITFFHILSESFAKMLILFSADVEHATVLKFLCGAFMIGFNLMLFLDKLWFSKYHHHDHHNTATTTEIQPEAQNIQRPEISRKKRALAIGTLIAFSFHSFLEGIALGSETPDLGMIGVILLFSFHKALDGLAVSLPLTKAGFSFKIYWTLVFVFCTITPIGILSAYGLMQGGPLTKYAGLIEGISGGVFMYISLFHIFHEELESSDRTLAKISTFAIAVLIMFGLEQVT